MPIRWTQEEMDAIDDVVNHHVVDKYGEPVDGNQVMTGLYLFVIGYVITLSFYKLTTGYYAVYLRIGIKHIKRIRVKTFDALLDQIDYLFDVYIGPPGHDY